MLAFSAGMHEAVQPSTALLHLTILTNQDPSASSHRTSTDSHCAVDEYSLGDFLSASAVL